MTTKRHLHGLAVLPLALLGLTLGAAVVEAGTFSEAELFFELNDTDGDLGIHVSIDGEAYSRLTITDPSGHTILKLRSRGRLARQGLTQLFLESAEPGFDELRPRQFFRRFPEGVYAIKARRQDGEPLEATVALRQVLAAPVANITVSGLPAAASCDAFPLPSVSEPVLIDWDPVTRSHPRIGKSGPVEIVRYQFFVEREGVKLGVDLPPTVTAFQVPSDIIALGDAFKFEIIARTASGNNTAIESCFEVQ